MILALVTIVLPEILARWAARRRRGLAVLLIPPVIVGIVLTAYRVALRYAPVLSQMPAHGPGSRPVVFLVMLGLGFAAIVFVRQVWRSAARRRWWVLGVVLAIFLLQLIWLPVILAPAGMGPSEQLQWDRWYLMPLEASYDTGLLIIIWKILAALVRVIRRGLRAVIARVRSKPARTPATEPIPS